LDGASATKLEGLVSRGVSRFPFHQVYQSAAVFLANQGINFPVNQSFALLHNLRTVFNTDPIWQSCTPIILAIASGAFSMLPEMGIRGAAGLLISQNVLIDSLVANSYLLALFRPSLNYLKARSDVNEVNLVETLIEEIVYHITKNRFSILEKRTTRELQIVSLIQEGKTSREIAKALVVSNKTVDFHRANIRKKLDLQTETGKRTNPRTTWYPTYSIQMTNLLRHHESRT